MNFKKSLLDVSQRIGAFFYAPSSKQIQVTLFVAGVALLTAGVVSGAIAQDAVDDIDLSVDPGTYNTARLEGAIAKILGYMEGPFGALIMIVSGLGAILSSAFGQYRAALGCLVVAVGAFILRSFVVTWFNLDNMQDVIPGES